MKNAVSSEFKNQANMHFEFTLREPSKQSVAALEKNSTASECLLTDREIMIVRCISDGKSSIEIAEHLFISHFTVNTHRKNILRKAGARNVAHLVQLAIANGWI